MGSGQGQRSTTFGNARQQRDGAVSPSAQRNSVERFDFDPTGEPSSSAVLASPACTTCTSSGTTCTLGDEHDSCTSCHRSGLDCSLASAHSHSRKRKLQGESSQAESSFKRASSVAPEQEADASTPAASAAMIEGMANVGGATILKYSIGLQNDRFSRYIGHTTDLDHALINLSLFDSLDESPLSNATLRRMNDKHACLVLEDKNTIDYENIKQDLDDIEAIVAPNGKRLVDVYFKMVHPTFPVLQRHIFYEMYDRGYRDFTPCLLAAVYLVAINWWDQDEELASQPRPNVRALERLARSTFADETSRPKLSTVQAGLILSQRPEGETWAMTAQLVALAQEIGLHVDPATWKIPLWERGLRKRVAWALYMQEKWSALVHGMPSHIISANWSVRWLSVYDFPDVDWDENDPEERTDIEKGRLIFLRGALLSGILAEISETFYTLQAMYSVENAGPQGAHLVLSLAKPIQLKLKDWYANLPPFIRLESLSAGALSNRPSSVGYLHIAYYAAEITLHRRIITCLSHNSQTVDPYVQHVCRSAAKARLISAMDFVNRLTPIHLNSFWFFSSKSDFALIGTFGSLLWATSPGREEADWYRRRLSEYRWTLSVSSQSVNATSPTVLALRMLDLSTDMLKQLPEKPSMSRSGSLMNVAAMARSRSTFANRASILGGYSQVASPRLSSLQSPRTEDYSSADEDDEMEDDYGRRI